MRHWLAPILCLALASLTRADSLWINPATGSDSAPGTEAEPKRTVAAALDSLAAGGTSHVLFLAEGLYNVAGGEAFPWRSFPSIRFEGAGAGMRIELDPGQDTLIDDGADFISVEGLRVEGTETQRLVELTNGGTAQVRRCQFEDCGYLISQVGGLDRQMRITVEDSTFLGCSGLGNNQGYGSSPGFTEPVLFTSLCRKCPRIALSQGMTGRIQAEAGQWPPPEHW